MQDLFPNMHSEEALRLFKSALAIDKRKERSKAINRLCAVRTSSAATSRSKSWASTASR